MTRKIFEIAAPHAFTATYLLTLEDIKHFVPHASHCWGLKRLHIFQAYCVPKKKQRNRIDWHA